MKLMILLGATVIGGVTSWIGALLDHGNFLGGWSLLFGFIGSFAGIWVGYKAAKYLSL